MRRSKHARSTYKTARCVLRHEDNYLLAVHSSFWRKRKHRWGLPGGSIERDETPLVAVQRELAEELDVYLSDFTPIGAFTYKGNEHMVYGAEVDYAISDYDEGELLDLRWFSLSEVQRLNTASGLHAGYELQAIERWLNQEK